MWVLHSGQAGPSEETNSNHCRGPLNEDVFAASPCPEEKAPHPSVQELTEQIHRLLMQVSAELALLCSACPHESTQAGQVWKVWLA